MSFVTGKLREEVYNRYKNKCRICKGTKNLEVHHVKPSYCGGLNNSIYNLVLLCRRCHYTTHAEYNRIREKTERSFRIKNEDYDLNEMYRVVGIKYFHMWWNRNILTKIKNKCIADMTSNTPIKNDVDIN